MATITLAEIQRRTGVTDSKLNLEVSDEHLNKIADSMDNWSKYAEVLNLKGHQMQEIRTNLGVTYLMRIQQTLKYWKENDLFEATYRRLAEAALKVGDSTIAIQVYTLSKECQVNESPDSFPSFSAWLEHMGVSKKDIGILEGEGFTTAQGFATMVPGDLQELNLTKAGKRLLPQLLLQLNRGAVAPPPRAQPSSVSQPACAVPQVTSTSGLTNELNNDIDYSETGCFNAYNTMVRCSVSLNRAMSEDPKVLAQALYSAGFISQATLEETNELNETKSSKGSRLYGAVLGRVRNFPKKFADFIVILRQKRELYGDMLSEIDRVYFGN